MIALFFDTETTGFRSSTFSPEVVQVGAILQDTDSRRILGELNLIVKADNPIPERVTAIHGIDDALADQFGIDKHQADAMFAQLAARADLLVAHNIDFDIDIIKHAWRFSPTILETKDKYCTMKSATEIVGIPKAHGGGMKYPKLVDAHEFFFQRGFEGAHDAMADVRACRDVYFALQDYLAGVPA